MKRQYQVFSGEDPILADVRRTHPELFAEFGYDLDAYVAELRARQQEREARTGVYMPDPAPEAGSPKADTA